MKDKRTARDSLTDFLLSQIAIHTDPSAPRMTDKDFLIWAKYFFMALFAFLHGYFDLYAESKELNKIINPFFALAFYASLVIFPMLTLTRYLRAIGNLKAFIILVIDIIFMIIMFSLMYLYIGILDVNHEPVSKFSHCLYFSIVTWTTLGYGDFRPDESTRLLAASEALLGYLYMGIALVLLVKIIKLRNNE